MNQIDTLAKEDVITLSEQARALLGANEFLFVMGDIDWAQVSKNIDEARHRLDKVELIFAKERAAGRLR